MTEPGLEGLSEAERAALADELAEAELASKGEVPDPVILLTAGQPGSGKSSIGAVLASRFAGAGGVVQIDPDEIRPMLPYMDPLIEAGSLEIPEYANRDAGAIAYLLVCRMRDSRRNILLDGTLRNEDRAISLVGDMRAAGYTVEVHGMAVYPGLSHARTYLRLAGEMDDSESGFGRGVDDGFHDECATEFVETIKRLYTDRCVDRIVLYHLSTGVEPGVALDVYRSGERWCPQNGSPDRTPMDVLQEAHRPSREALEAAIATWESALEAFRDLDETEMGGKVKVHLARARRALEQERGPPEPGLEPPDRDPEQGFER